MILNRYSLFCVYDISDDVQLSSGDDSAFSVAKEIIECCSPGKWEGKFNELWAQVETAMHYGLLTIDEVIEEYDEPEIGKGEKVYWYINVQYQ